MVQRITIAAEQCSGSTLTLTADQAHYLIDVLRLQAGDRFIAQDGTGTQWIAALKATPKHSPSKSSPSKSSPPKQQPQADILETIQHAITTAPLRLIAAPTKGNSFDQVIRQATELGVTHIHPVVTERTVLKPSSNRRLRWQRIAAEASEQSERVTVPQIFEPLSFLEYLAHFPLEENPTEIRYICGARTNNSHLLAAIQAQISSEHLPGITLAIGPEGGWTSREISDAICNGYEEVSLGPVILRAVTASITALSLVTAARNLLI